MGRKADGCYLFEDSCTLTDKQKKRVLAFCAKHDLLNGPGRLMDWLGDRTEWYMNRERHPDLREGRVVYRLVIGRDFAPHTFLHRSLNEQFIRTLAARFGTRKAFRAYVMKGGELTVEGAYAAWLFRMVPRKRLQQTIDQRKPKHHEKPFKALKKKRKKRSS